MATFYSNTAKGYSLKLDIWERANSTNLENNTTIVDWQLRLIATSSYFAPLQTIGNLYVAGNHVWAHQGNLSLPGFNSELLLSASGMVVAHNIDGTGSASASADFRSTVNTQSWHVPQLNVSGSIGLSRIPRGPRVRSNGQWRNTIPYVKHNGQWRIAIPYTKHGGQWKIGGG